MFQAVTCFPATEDAWRQVSIDSYGLALVWTNRFEVHVDQVIGLADHVEKAGIPPSASAPAYAAADQETPRKLGTLRGTVTYLAPDFDAPLDDFKEHMK